MKQKILVFLLSVVMMSFMVSCGGDKNTTEKKQPDPVPAKEKTADDKIDDMIAGMSLEEKVGQMFIVRCPVSDDVSAVSEYHLGAYILFADDFRPYTPEQVKEHTDKYQAAATIPLIIGVDEEGGTVCRISSYSQFRDTPFLSPREIYADGGMDALKTDAKEKCQLLKSLGINLNFAPVCDISTDPADFIYDRSLGQNTDTVGEFAKTMVEIGNENNVGSVLKHFPGYGNNVDTHTGIAYDYRDYSSFEENDFVPFKTGMSGGSCAVLVSHNVVECMDSEMPASLSSKVHGILREDMKFNGVIMTDDLSMEAITDFVESSAAAVDAVKAGNDMLCCDDYTVQVPAVIQACRDGEIEESQIDASVHRILKWKYDLGLLKL